MNRQKRESLNQGQSADREQPSSGKQKQASPDQSSGKQQQQKQAAKPAQQPQQQGSNASQGGFANWEHKQHLDE